MAQFLTYTPEARAGTSRTQQILNTEEGNWWNDKGASCQKPGY
jgi:hypothetical protein